MSSSEEKIDLSNGLESVNISSTTSDTSDGKKELSNDNSDQNIRVFTRIRPLSTKEKNEESKDSIKACEGSKSITIENNRNFEFDGVLGPNSTQKEVYDKTAGKLIHNIFKGWLQVFYLCIRYKYYSVDSLTSSFTFIFALSSL